MSTPINILSSLAVMQTGHELLTCRSLTSETTRNTGQRMNDGSGEKPGNGLHLW